MKICIIGIGYVGLVAGAGFAETGNDVYCVDIDRFKIDKLRRGVLPIFEPGLDELIKRNKSDRRLRFSTSVPEGVKKSQIIFIAVGTPSRKDGTSDLKYVSAAVESVAAEMNDYKLVVLKSTVPVGTADRVRETLSKKARHPFHVVNNPEFLKEGAALDDFMKPDRVVIGADDPRPVAVMRELYAPFLRTGAPFLVMDNRSAELTKYAANAMLASRISFMNEIANLCGELGADVDLVRRGIGTDRRIGPSFLFPGVGYGGSCFPKDIKALIEAGREHGLPMDMVSAAHRVNETQKNMIVDWVTSYFSKQHRIGGAAAIVRKGAGQMRPHKVGAGSVRKATKGGRLKGKRFAIWGLSFKPQTDDMREAPSISIIEGLLGEGARIQAYDPEALATARTVFGRRILYFDQNYEALRGADALILVTEWNVFRNPDFPRMKKLLRQPVIFDGRNQYDPHEMREMGFTYFAVGRPQAQIAN